MSIKVLAEDVVSKIAAGEVIERPASVVKELIENAIDAGATEIIVRTENAGKRLIEIIDNGCGIPADELAQAVQRHATSKLRSADDLFHIHTLGFRGEALAAAGSVALLTISSRTADAPHGQKIIVEGGNQVSLQPIAMSVGTTVQVENLFFNTPARLKFLKSDSTEKNQIETLLARYALAYPHIRWKGIHENRVGIFTAGNDKPRETLSAIYGVEIARQLLEVEREDEGLSVHGFISPVALTRSNRREINFFVNGRWIQDIQLSSAVTRAYQSLIMVGRFPIAALFVTIDPEKVDVNVHPSKAEIRFESIDQVISMIHRAVRFGLVNQSPIPEISQPSQWQTWADSAQQSGQSSAFPRPAPFWQRPSESNAEPADESEAVDGFFPQDAFSPASHQPDFNHALTQPQEENAQPVPAPRIFPILRWIGQIGGTYILAEGPDGLYLIDQHAAHERVLFEKLMHRNALGIGSQTLLDPEIVQLPSWQADLLEKNITVLESLGFRISAFGPSAFRISAIPDIFKKGNPSAAVRAVVEDFEENEEPLKEEIEALLAGRVCKRMAVKGGQILSEEEQKALLRDLESCASPRTCPHGRPTMIHLSINLLEQQFGRKGKI